MEIIKHRVRKLNDFEKQLSLPDKNCFFYDIETTGFSKEHCFIYMIGTACCKDGDIITTQFFAEGKEDEAALLSAFADFSAPFSSAFSFNGLTFDLPFLQKRNTLYSTGNILPDTEQTDLYRLARKLSPLFPLENLKQKSLEEYFGLHRTDLYNGGELVKIYNQYILDQSPEKKRLLLLHNYEDLCGMFTLLPLFACEKIADGEFSLAGYDIHDYNAYDSTRAKELHVTTILPYRIPTALTFSNGYFTLRCPKQKGKKQELLLSIPLTQGNKKLFFPDYKKYYYLPMEDRAVHKSVACFVDTAHRTQAKASTCYQKQNGLFLYKPDFSCHPELQKAFPSFYNDYSDKIPYLLWRGDISFSNAEKILRCYVRTFFQY